MTEPLVCCVMLTKDRPQMAKRAVECFRSQTYQNARLCVYDTGKVPTFNEEDTSRKIGFFNRPENAALTIGELRNRVAGIVANTQKPPDIFVHIDSDDWSHPNRISEQVALLQASGKEAVGYRDCLFWAGDVECPVCNGGLDDDGVSCFSCKDVRRVTGTGNGAWLYHNDDPRYCLGTSLCYWRTAWQRNPFPNISRGEDQAWLRGVESLGWSSLIVPRVALPIESCEPRMICSVHAGNHVPYDLSGPSWKRVPEWDSHCRGVMAL